MSMFRKAGCQLKQASGKVGEIALKKLEMVLARNPWYSVLKNASDILNGCDADLPEGFNPVQFLCSSMFHFLQQMLKDPTLHSS